MLFRFLILSFLIVANLFALSDKQILQRADLLLESDVKSKQFRAYNDYKNLYLRSIMNEDKKLKIKSLEGIVKSGTKLHIDISNYRDELNEVNFKSVKSNQKVHVTSFIKLENAQWTENELTLIFNRKMQPHQVKHFTIFDKKKKEYKYVYDIRHSSLTKSHNVRHNSIKRVRLAQYNPNTIRLVLESTELLDVSYNIEENSLVISVDNLKARTVEKEQPSKTLPPKRLDRSKVIVIDAGHGGKDPGAVGYKKYREKIIVMDIGKKLKKILTSRGYKVYMTRDSDNFVKLSHRTEYANKKSADIFISIHANAVAKKNAAKVHGIESYFLSKSRSDRAKKVAEIENSADISDMNYYGKESFLNTLNSHNIVASNKLAIDLQRGMLGSLEKTYKNVHDGGVREGPFWVLIGAQMPSVLVEVGFITHPREARRLVNSTYQSKLAIGMANGIERYFLNN